MTLLLRLLHVGLGVFWAGAMLFATFFLMPAMAEAGPDGARVMAGLQRRRLLEVLPAVALITIITGFWMYFRIAGQHPAWAASTTGMVLGLGGVAAVLALVLGLTVMRPAQNRLVALSATLAAMSEGAERAAAVALAGQLRQRIATFSRVIAGLLLIAVVTMAVARYL